MTEKQTTTSVTPKKPATFMYFVAAENTIDIIKKAGLEYAFDEFCKPNIPLMASTGPEGSLGFLISTGTPDSKNMPKFSPENQTWIPMPGNKGIFVGMANDRQILPEELLRENYVTGYFRKLADDQDWAIPVVCEFPTAITFDSAGALVQTPLERFKVVCEYSDRIWSHMRRELGQDTEGENIQIEEIAGMAVEILAVNYRISKGEASLLKILESENAKTILQTFCDYAKFLEVELDKEKQAKKNDSKPETESAGINDG